MPAQCIPRSFWMHPDVFEKTSGLFSKNLGTFKKKPSDVLKVSCEIYL